MEAAAPVRTTCSTCGTVRRLVELMQEFELAEIDLRQAEQRIRLRQGPGPGVVPAGTPAAAAPAAAPARRQQRRPLPPARASAAVGRRERHLRHEPDGRHVLRRVESRLAAVRQGRRPGRPRDGRLHRRGDEGVQRNSRRSAPARSPPCWSKTATPSSTARSCSASRSSCTVHRGHALVP